ncbi:hypothetical protein EGN72_07330 [Pseudorhodobacter sp. E13]|nr:hypothetical protein EGN72_07330 [Pseudorhodobacter sp. E13]
MGRAHHPATSPQRNRFPPRFHAFSRAFGGLALPRQLPRPALKESLRPAAAGQSSQAKSAQFSKTYCASGKPPEKMGRIPQYSRICGQIITMKGRRLQIA